METLDNHIKPFRIFCKNQRGIFLQRGFFFNLVINLPLTCEMLYCKGEPCQSSGQQVLKLDKDDKQTYIILYILFQKFTALAEDNCFAVFLPSDYPGYNCSSHHHTCSCLCHCSQGCTGHFSRQTDRQTYRLINIQIDRQKYRQKDRQKERQTESQTERQIERQPARQTKRQTERQT